MTRVGSVFWARSHALFAPQMPFRGHNWTTEAYGLIRSQWPYLNRSIEANQTRHYITLTCDQGPGSCEYAKRELMRLGSLPSFWNPADPSRVIGAFFSIHLVVCVPVALIATHSRRPSSMEWPP